MPTGIGGEVGWWCPSLDDTGNGTTTLYDLVSTNNGTLTNMDPATDWVADTASGGVRALDFDGTNDYVDTNYIPGVVSSLTISAWFAKTSLTRAYFLAGQSGTSSGIGFELYETVAYINVYGTNANQYAQFNWNLSGWHHWALVYNGSLSGNSNKAKVYVDGVLQTLTFAGTVQSTIRADGTFRIGQRPWATSYANHRFDDGRLFSAALTESQIVTLASKRGYQPIFDTRRRRYAGSYGL